MHERLLGHAGPPGRAVCVVPRRTAHTVLLRSLQSWNREGKRLYAADRISTTSKIPAAARQNDGGYNAQHRSLMCCAYTGLTQFATRAEHVSGEAASAQHGEGGARGGEHPAKTAAGHRPQERANREVRAAEVKSGNLERGNQDSGDLPKKTGTSGVTSTFDILFLPSAPLSRLIRQALLLYHASCS